MKNIFCIDLEDWFHQSLVSPFYYNKRSSVEKNTQRLLEIFSMTETTATFFCLGEVAEKHPGLIRQIVRQGHEIASHGYDHKLIYKQSPAEFKSDVKKSIGLLSDLSGKAIKGFRAPSWSITKNSLWALDILQELGFLYDSSIFPTDNFLYGIQDASPYINDLGVNGRQFLEVPPSTFNFLGKPYGFSGGFYFRVLPEFFIRMCTDKTNKNDHPAIFYLHPVEIGINIERVSHKLIDKTILEYGIKGCEKKLIHILERYKFDSIENVLNL
ncbi:MAG: DUF3473 domain-containing protein [Saccharofermentanales bacterium]